MKKICAILVALIMIFSLVCVAYAGPDLTFRCYSDKCNGTTQVFGCGAERKEKTLTECPDAIVNCVCYYVETIHTYVCNCCSARREVSTFSYQHSK